LTYPAALFVCQSHWFVHPAAPRTNIISGLVELDEQGYILTGPDLFRNGRWPRAWPLEQDPFLFETSVPGIFAVGDVRSGSGNGLPSRWARDPAPWAWFTATWKRSSNVRWTTKGTSETGSAPTSRSASPCPRSMPAPLR